MSSYSMNPKYTPSLSLNYRTEKFNFFLQGYMMNQAKLPNNEFTTRHYPNGDFTESQVVENRKQNHYKVKLGFDWTINEKQTLTVFGLYDYEWHIDTTKVCKRPFIEIRYLLTKVQLTSLRRLLMK